MKLAGSILLVDGRPMFPRVIQHRGEPLRLLKQLGFNAVWLPRPPATELLEEANRLGLWLVCPPPRPAAADDPVAVGAEPNRPPNPAQLIVRYGAPDLQSDAAGAPRVGEIGPQFDCVLAWDLGSELTEADLEATQRWAQQVRAADRRGNRPLICQPRTDLRGFSRPANLLLIDRRPLGTSFELSDYGTWVRRQPLLASPGTPVWTTVQTQPSEALRQQLALFDPGGQTPAGVCAGAGPTVGLFGRGGRKPRAGVRLRLAAGLARPGYPPAGDDPRTAEPRAQHDRTLGGRGRTS